MKAWPDLYWIDGRAGRRIAIMARPRAEDWLEDEIRAWKTAGLSTVLSLLEPAEEKSLGLRDERSHCIAHGIDFLSWPIPDRGVPSSLSGAHTVVADLLTRFDSGERIGIHCRAGIGRSALIAGCLLSKVGEKVHDIFPLISQARGLSVPDTEEQVRWLARFANAPATY